MAVAIRQSRRRRLRRSTQIRLPERLVNRRAGSLHYRNAHVSRRVDKIDLRHFGSPSSNGRRGLDNRENRQARERPDDIAPRSFGGLLVSISSRPSPTLWLSMQNREQPMRRQPRRELGQTSVANFRRISAVGLVWVSLAPLPSVLVTNFVVQPSAACGSGASTTRCSTTTGGLSS